MEFSIEQIAQLLGGKVEGDGQTKIKTISKIQEAQEGSISFLANPKYESFLYETQASAVIVSKEYVLKKPIEPSLIRVDDPYLSFSSLLEQYHKMTVFSKQGVEEPAFIAPSAEIGEGHYRGAFSYVGHKTKIGKNVKIYPQAYIGDNVSIGDNTVIYSGVKIYSGSQIGQNCTLQAGCVLGSPGFGYAPQPDGTYKTIPQLGNVILEDHVNIGANTTIDCATMGSTIVRSGVKLDNLIQIAHNVEIGKNTVIAAQTGIAGSAKIGENCVLAGHVGIPGHIEIANRTTIGAKSGITKSNTKEGEIVFGWPAFEHKQFFRSYSIFKKLPSVVKRIEELEEKVLNLSPLEEN